MMRTLSIASDPTEIREAFATFPSGVVVMAAKIDGESVGMVISSFTVGVSLEPVLVSVAIQNTSTTWPILRSSPRIGVSVLAEAHRDSVRQLAARGIDRFA